jgi:hypothetical protein
VDERFPGLVSPHTILPVQFFTCPQSRRAWTREQCLMAAVLADAIGVYLKPEVPRTSTARQVRRETRRWVHSNDRTWVFSFLRICEALDLDPNRVRRDLRLRRSEEPPPTISSSNVMWEAISS